MAVRYDGSIGKWQTVKGDGQVCVCVCVRDKISLCVYVSLCVLFYSETSI